MPLQWCDNADAVLDDLTAEKSSTDVVLFVVDNPKKAPTLNLVQATQGGRARVVEFLQHEAADDGIYIGVFLCSAIDARGTVVSVRRKYIQVTYMGPAVSVMIKGKMNSWMADLRHKLPHCALTVQLTADSVLDELDVDVLQASLLAAGGAHKPTRYSFTNRTLIGSLQIDEDAAARRAEEERVKREAELEAQRAAAAERKRLAEERKRLEAEEKARQEAQRKAAEEARRAEEEAKRKAAEEARLARIQAEEARRQAEAEARRKTAEEAERKRLEAERLAREEAERQRTKIMIDTNATLNGKTLVLLVSNLATNFAQSNQQDRVRTMLDGLGLPKSEIEEIDGSDANNKEQRNALFTLSGIRAKYPQMFMRQADGTLNFFGDFDTMEYYNDTGTLAQNLGVVSSQTERIVAVGDCSVVTATNATVDVGSSNQKKEDSAREVVPTVQASETTKEADKQVATSATKDAAPTAEATQVKEVSEPDTKEETVVEKAEVAQEPAEQTKPADQSSPEVTLAETKVVDPAKDDEPAVVQATANGVLVKEEQAPEPPSKTRVESDAPESGSPDATRNGVVGEKVPKTPTPAEESAPPVAPKELIAEPLDKVDPSKSEPELLRDESVVKEDSEDHVGEPKDEDLSNKAVPETNTTPVVDEVLSKATNASAETTNPESVSEPKDEPSVPVQSVSENPTGIVQDNTIAVEESEKALSAKDSGETLELPPKSFDDQEGAPATMTEPDAVAPVTDGTPGNPIEDDSLQPSTEKIQSFAEPSLVNGNEQKMESVPGTEALDGAAEKEQPGLVNRKDPPGWVV